MRKTNVTDRPRFVLGPVATELTLDLCPPGLPASAEHLDAGISALRTEVEVQRRLVAKLEDDRDRDRQQLREVVSTQNTGMRGVMMAMGQLIREVSVIRKVLVISGATSSEQAERLFNKAVPDLIEMRATLAVWREREGLEIPEFNREAEDRMLELLTHAPGGKQIAEEMTREIREQDHPEDSELEFGREPEPRQGAFNLDRERDD